jgi:hypothetical protein
MHGFTAGKARWWGDPCDIPQKSGGTLRTNPLLPDLYVASADYSTVYSFPDLGSIELEVDNLHALDRIYTYENGALILKEIKRSILLYLTTEQSLLSGRHEKSILACCG